jgi:hypothetical protein
MHTCVTYWLCIPAMTLGIVMWYVNGVMGSGKSVTIHASGNLSYDTEWMQSVSQSESQSKSQSQKV